ncbi:MAG TPA: hypothetical protein P5274_00550 [Candidatus Paceibacterota bacterium]|nr:hypothetical protein [Candidatus Paceibacterota bacterium]
MAFIKKKWFKNITKSSPFYGEDLDKLPLEYAEDLEFVLGMSNFPMRYTKPLHLFISKNKIPKISEPTKKVRIYFKHHKRNLQETIIFEIDPDSGKKDVINAWGEVSGEKTIKGIRGKKSLKSFSNTTSGFPQKIVPTANFPRLMKIADNDKNLKKKAKEYSTTDEITDNYAKWRNTHQLRTNLKRNMKIFSTRRISLEKKGEYENYLKKIKPGF